MRAEMKRARAKAFAWGMRRDEVGEEAWEREVLAAMIFFGFSLTLAQIQAATRRDNVQIRSERLALARQQEAERRESPSYKMHLSDTEITKEGLGWADVGLRLRVAQEGGTGLFA